MDGTRFGRRGGEDQLGVGQAFPPEEERRLLTRGLARLIDAAAQGEGVTASPLPGLVYFRATAPGPRSPALLDPTFCVVASGEKKAIVGEEVYTYDPLTYRVLAVPLPVEIAITRASKDEPLLGIALDIDLAALTAVVLEMEDTRPPSDDRRPPRGIYTSGVDTDLLAAVNRLLRSVGDAGRREVLAPMAIREILFHLLSGAQGEVLRSIALRDGRSQRVTRALRFIRNHYKEPLNVPAIARSAYMSPSTLHHDFKAVTSTSPMQYLKKIRLHEARLLLLHGDKTAAGAAREVGYQSPSQFSREYRRLFGAPPGQHLSALQAEGMPQV